MSLPTTFTSSFSTSISSSSERLSESCQSCLNALTSRVGRVGEVIITTPKESGSPNWSLHSMVSFLGSTVQSPRARMGSEFSSEEEFTSEAPLPSAAEEEDDEFECVSGTSSPLGWEEATEDKVARIISFLEGSDLESIVYLLKNADKQVKSELTRHPKFMELVTNNIQLRAFFKMV